MTLYDYCLTNNRENLLDEWDEIQNGDLSPQDIPYGSSKLIHWKCMNGHSWTANLNNRTNSNLKSGCPYCAGLRAIPGVNDFATRHPQLLPEWAEDLNIGIDCHSVGEFSNKQVWWRCKAGHTWKARIADRVINEDGCPYCANRKILPGYNDLASVAPDLAAEWNYERNSAKRPDKILFGSSVSVWWKCRLGHEWKTSIDNRYTKKSKCPYCTGRKLLVGFNDLATTEPMLTKQWHPYMNGDLTPQMLQRGSHEKVWWVCQDDHVWKAQVNSRATGKRCGCPVCNGCVNVKRQHLYDRILVEAKFNSNCK